MSKYNSYTAIIGIISVFFMLSVFFGDLHVVVKILLISLGVGIFIHSAVILHRELKARDFLPPQKIFDKPKIIDKIILLSKDGDEVFSWDLYGKTSAVIGKDTGDNLVDIDLSKNPYAAMIDVEHAVLNYTAGNWYIEDLGSRNGISIQKLTQEKSYKLKVILFQLQVLKELYFYWKLEQIKSILK